MTVGPIYLNRVEARRFFLRHRYVYTLRDDRGVGITHARQGSRHESKALGEVSVFTVLDRPTDLQLDVFVGRSGFKTVAEWREAAGPKQLHLYLVQRWPK